MILRKIQLYRALHVLILMLFSLLISCSKKGESERVKEVPVTDVVQMETLQRFAFEPVLESSFEQALTAWPEYFEASLFLKENYEEIGPTEAKELASDLSDLVVKMNDSMQIESLNKKAVFARLNVFESEVLRLEDMASISSIKNEEVLVQVGKVIQVYNAINAKINTLYAQQAFDALIDFDESMFDFNDTSEKPYYKAPKRRSQSGAGANMRVAPRDFDK